MPTRLSRYFLVPASMLAWLVASAGPADRALDVESAPLPDSERRQLTNDLVSRYPDLASSPGIKFAEAPVNREGRISIMVYFYPHAESHGIKEAYRASCAWQNASRSWSCYDMVIRRYLSLPSQDYEVRVSGDLASDEALALIEGSRRALAVIVPEETGRPDTVFMITPGNDGYLIAWGTEDEAIQLGMTATLSEGGDPTNPDDWLARLN